MDRGEPALSGPTDDPFQLLGLGLDADDDAVRSAYRVAVRQHPPEREPEIFKRIRAAYEALRDPTVRARAVVLGRFLVPEPGPLTLEELGGRPIVPPPQEEALRDLRDIALASTDLARTRFDEDMRDVVS